MAERMLYFIPARGGSKRFPLKNIAMFRGKPMIVNVIENIRQAHPGAEIVVSTDQIEIEKVAKGAGVTVDHRPAELGQDRVSIIEVLKDYLKRHPTAPEMIAVVYPTAVLVTPQRFIAAEEKFSQQVHLASLMGATEFNLHPWQALSQDSSGNYVPYFPDLYLKQSQEFPEMVASCGCFYYVRKSKFLANPSFYGQPLSVLKLPRHEAVDINYPQDLEYAEIVAQVSKKISAGSDT